MKKCILIDTENKKVSEVTIEEGIQPIYDVLKIDCFTVVAFDFENDVYIDDNGLLTMTPKSTFFTIKGYNGFLVGNGLIMGIDSNSGESKDTTLSVEYVESIVKFYSHQEVVKMFPEIVKIFS